MQIQSNTYRAGNFYQLLYSSRHSIKSLEGKCLHKMNSKSCSSMFRKDNHCVDHLSGMFIHSKMFLVHIELVSIS
jgi:hypothetical protein